MNIVKRDPWQLFNELGNLFENRGMMSQGEGSVTASDWVPAVDIKEDEKQFTIHADIPGVDPKDIDVHMENGVLSISGEKRSESTEEKEGYKRVERTCGSFLRRFTLPDTAEADKIKAHSENGVLVVEIPKHKRVQPRKIEVSH
jgi:HSP20 family protein